MTLEKLYFKGKQILKENGVESYSFDAAQIIKKVFNISRHELILKGQRPVSTSEEQMFLSFIEQRKNGRPLQYIIEKWQFMSLDFEVGEGVLIPRDDTQVLVDESVKILKRTENPNVLDLCSGSGNVAIAIGSFIKQAKIYAVEISQEAIKFLNRNIKINGSKNITALNDDVLNPSVCFKEETFDLIVSNPPYIKSKDIDNLQREVKNEPRIALDGGEDGLTFYRVLVKNFIKYLKPGGHICVEVGFDQSSDVKNIFNSCCFLDRCYVVNDINNIERVVVAKARL